MSTFRAARDGYVTPKLLWLKANQPKVLDAMHCFLTCSGFIVSRLTGELTCDFTQAYGNRFFDIRRERWCESTAAALAADQDGVWHVRPPRVRVVSAVGSGDSMLAGITWGVVRGFALLEAVRYGVAAGTANALVLGAGGFAMTDFERVLLGVDVERV